MKGKWERLGKSTSKSQDARLKEQQNELANVIISQIGELTNQLFCFDRTVLKIFASIVASPEEVSSSRLANFKTQFAREIYRFGASLPAFFSRRISFLTSSTISRLILSPDKWRHCWCTSIILNFSFWERNDCDKVCIFFRAGGFQMLRK